MATGRIGWAAAQGPAVPAAVLAAILAATSACATAHRREPSRDAATTHAQTTPQRSPDVTTEALRLQNVFTMHELAPGVHVAEVLPDAAAYAFANSLVVIGTEGVLVVDTQQSVTAARALIAEIDRLTDAPVRWVVNTHWHGDHVNGNQAYAAAFPGVEFIAHASVAADMRAAGRARREAELAELPASIALRREWLASGTGPDGAALTAAQTAALKRSLALREAYLMELAGIDPDTATRVATDRLALEIGGHRVQLLHPGPAHTRGDLIVVLPDLAIVAVGDLLEAAVPWFGDAYPAGWLRALDTIASLRAEVIVPSHGPVARDTSLLDDTRNLLAAIVEGRPDATWSELEQHWYARYRVQPAAFRKAMEEATARLRLEEASP